MNVHPDKGWLGAFPDGVVHDPNPTDTQRILILKIKCPYTVSMLRYHVLLLLG